MIELRALLAEAQGVMAGCLETYACVLSRQMCLSLDETLIRITAALSAKDEGGSDAERYLKVFAHTHINNGRDDACLMCGLDLRDRIHLRYGDTRKPLPPLPERK